MSSTLNTPAERPGVRVWGPRRERPGQKGSVTVICASELEWHLARERERERERESNHAIEPLEGVIMRWHGARTARGWRRAGSAARRHVSVPLPARPAPPRPRARPAQLGLERPGGTAVGASSRSTGRSPLQRQSCAAALPWATEHRTQAPCTRASSLEHEGRGDVPAAGVAPVFTHLKGATGYSHVSQ